MSCYILIAVAALLLRIALLLPEEYWRYMKLRRIVAEALEAYEQNGYGTQAHFKPASDTAEDLVACHPQLEQYSPLELEVHIIYWRRKHPYA